MDNIIIIGAGAFGHELADFVTESIENGKLKGSFGGFLDDNLTRYDHREWRFLGGLDSYSPKSNDRFLISVGTPASREMLLQRVLAKQGTLMTFVHPLANVSKYATIMSGSIIGPYATISYDAKIGQNVMLNSYAAVGHHSIVGDNTVICPKCLVAGECNIGRSVFIGSSVTIVPKIVVGEGAKLAAGSVVFRNVRANMLAAGNPAKQHNPI